MSFSRQEECPESTLADDDTNNGGTVSNVQRSQLRYAGRGYLRGTPQLQGGRGNGPGQRFGNNGYRSPHLRQNWEPERVDIDRGAMVSIGKANSSAGWKWNQQQGQQRNNGRGGNAWTARSHQGRGTGSAPRRQETPFTLGVMTMQTTKRTERTEEEGSDKKFVMDKNVYRFDPLKVPTESNPHQLRPSPAMYAHAQTLFKKDIQEWGMQDFLTPGSSDGTSILVSAFVDYAASTLKTDMSMSQQFTLAHMAIGTAPQRLLEYFKDPRKAMHFMEWVLTKAAKTPPVMEPLLCPIDTPNLIVDELVKEKITDGDLPVEEQAIVIEAFVRCYYPKHAAMIMDMIVTFPQEILRGYIEIPGKIGREMRNMNKPVNFSPPKWYRLSLHPDTVLQTTPRLQKKDAKETTGMQISVPDIALKLTMEIDELVKLPHQKIRTAILTAIPLVFEDRISREGCLEAFEFFDNASMKEIFTFLGRDTKGEDNEEVTEVKCAQMFRYLVRFEHTDKKIDGYWTQSAVEIFRQWINLIHPIIRARGETLVISTHIFAPQAVDRLILLTPYELEEEEMKRHTVVKEYHEGLAQFEVWIKSSCERLPEILKGTDERITKYMSAMSAEKMTVKYRSRMPDTLVPVLIIGGSIETAADSLIEEELYDRLLRAGIKATEVPDYYVESVELSTSDGRYSGRIKCVVAARQDACRLQDMTTRVTTPATRTRYLVTRDYAYKKIAYPPTATTDKDIMDTIREQRNFNASSVRTSIFGLTGIDPFRDVPEYTKDLCTREKRKNEQKSVAYYLLTMKMIDREGRMVSSPVTRVSTNPTGTKLYLHALRTEAAELVRFTEEVMQLLHIWYEKNDFRLKGDLVEALQQIKETQPVTQLEQLAMNRGTYLNNGETNKAQQKFDGSRTREEVIKTAKEGLDTNFTKEAESTTLVAAKDNSRGETTLQATESGRKTQSRGETPSPATESGKKTLYKTAEADICQELVLVKDGLLVQSNKIDKLTNRVQEVLATTTDKPESASLATISTLIGESTQSSISSITEVATVVCAHMDKQSIKIQTAVTKNSDEILAICKKIPTIDERIEELRTLVTRQEHAAEAASEVARKTNEQQSLIIKMLEAQQEYFRRVIETEGEMSVNSGHGEAIQDTCHDEAAAHDTSQLEDATHQMQSASYTEEVRQKARHVLSLFETMPYTKIQATGPTGKDEIRQNETQASSAGVDGLKVCKACGKRDHSLLYCDKCDDLGSLYHAGCMTYVEGLTEYHCNKCYHGEVDEHEVEIRASSMNTTIPNLTADNDRVGGMLSTSEKVREDKEANDKSGMSMSPSSSSSSSSSVEAYRFRYKQNTPRTTTLPSLNDMEQLKKDTPQAKNTPEISPVQTRAQRLANAITKKPREDAFDTSDEEDASSDK